jgi:hypothetical protein
MAAAEDATAPGTRIFVRLSRSDRGGGGLAAFSDPVFLIHVMTGLFAVPHDGGEEAPEPQ